MPTPPEKPTPPKSVSLPVAGDTPAPAPAGKPRKRKELWYDNGLRFACTQCGNCCTGGPGYVWLTINDMVKISQYLKMEIDAFTRAYVKRVGNRYSLMEQINYDCVFLTRDPATQKAGCKIYPVRPTQCRTWPFWNQNLRAPETWSAASERCPGMCDADAPLYDVTHIEKAREHPESP